MGQISVQGTGKLSVKPDIANVSFSVVTTGKRTSEAISKNNERMKQLGGVVEKFDIKDTDRKTSGFGITPNYEYFTPKKGQKDRPPKLTGYTCTNGMNLKVRDLDKLSDILGALTDAGADSLHFGFGVDNVEKHEDEARQLAYDSAYRKANLYCRRAAVNLGGIMTLSESVGRGGLRAYGAPGMAGGAVTMSAAIESVPVEAGEEEITVMINVTFELTGSGVSSRDK